MAALLQSGYDGLSPAGELDPRLQAYRDRSDIGGTSGSGSGGWWGGSGTSGTGSSAGSGAGGTGGSGSVWR